jgi:hypothetical protein
MKSQASKRAQRILAFLAKGAVTVRASAVRGNVLLDGGERGTMGEDEAVFTKLVHDGFVRRYNSKASITHGGKLEFKRCETVDSFAAQYQERGEQVIETAQGRERVIVNDAESPLALLWRRKDRNGRPFLSEREYRAGERLRADYTHGQIMPRLGIDWSSLGGGAGRGIGAANGLADMSDTTLAARGRVEQALNAVGPELAGVLVDVCCFLKGLERVEAERGWPVRSAKVVLKSALGVLARHYEPPARQQSGHRPLLHWGAADFRPRIS